MPASPARATRRLDAFVSAVCAAGLGAFIALAVTTALFANVRMTPMVVLMAVMLVVSELRPVKVARGEDGDDEITISSIFTMCLAIVGPLVVGVAAQMAAVLIDEVRRRKPPRRICFNAAQYTLALVAARCVYAGFTGRAVAGTGAPMGSADIAPALLAAVVFFVVNHGLVSVAVSFDTGQTLLRTLAHDLRFLVSTSGVLLSFAPVVVGTAQLTLWLLPLLLVPIAAIHKSAALAAERERQALHDSLTGLPNRELLHDRMTRLLLDSARVERTFAVLLLDVDHFKEINDTLGHHVGDLLLRDVAQRLETAVREGDTVARLGGDEFAMLLASMHTVDEAVVVAERVVAALAEPFTVEGVRLDVQASIGIAVSPDHGVDVDTLVQRADVALYTAKETRGCWAMYSPEEDRHTIERLTLLGQLRAGLESGQLLVFYQPKSDARTGHVVGVEALARWQHPVRGLLPPDDFIPLAENTGLIGGLTFEVLHQALRQLCVWRRRGLTIGVSVNLSVRQLTDLDLPRDIAALLADYGLPPDVLTLEVTESTIMADPSRTMAVLRQLADLGIALSIDDFGTGYSSLSYLKRLQAQELKIDKSFVMGMSRNSNDAVIVRSTIELGHNLGLRMVAEGVEDAETWRLLRGLGCDIVQGFHLSRPLPPHEITELLSAARLRLGAIPDQVTPAAGSTR